MLIRLQVLNTKIDQQKTNEMVTVADIDKRPQSIDQDGVDISLHKNLSATHSLCTECKKYSELLINKKKYIFL